MLPVNQAQRNSSAASQKDIHTKISQIKLEASENWFLDITSTELLVVSEQE